MKIERDFLLECRDIVRQSGNIINRAWKAPRTVRHKGAIDLVTETDVAVQEWLRARLAGILPQAAFLGEEGGSDAGLLTSELCWVVDPLDGTTNFVHGIPLISTSIALCQAGVPVLGIVNLPVMGECFYGARHAGVWRDEETISVSSSATLEDCLAAASYPYDIGMHMTPVMRQMENVLASTQGVRRLGSAAVQLAYVACGRLDIFYEFGLKPWDIAAGWLLTELAGGLVTDFRGAPFSFGQTLLAANSHVHQQALALLQ